VHLVLPVSQGPREQGPEEAEAGHAVNAECSKTPFLSWPDANKALAGTRRNRGSRHNRKEKNIYRCSICSFWHLTSRKLQ